MTTNPYLEGNFAPVEEEVTVFDLPVVGSIPRSLNGRLLRIGPNPIAPNPVTHNWLLGNGMVHGLRLRDGEAEWYRNRFVVDDEIAAAKGLPPVAGPDPFYGGGTANTNVIGHAGSTFAIVESGNPPVELTYDLDTVRRSDFESTLSAGYTAHPKRDPDTGELHAAVYSPMLSQIQYVVLGVDGRVRKTVDVPTPGRSMAHDCAITENFFVLLDMPCVLGSTTAQQGASSAYQWDESYGARVGLLPREGGADDVIWFEIEPCYITHSMNAYEDEQGCVVLVAIRHPKMFAKEFRGPYEGPPALSRWTFDPARGAVKEECLDDFGQEFPRQDERRIGKPYRYGYSVAANNGYDLNCVMKHDLKTNSKQTFSQGQHKRFMEPVFVPTSESADEDDGWLLTYAYDGETDLGEVLVLDASDLSNDPIATIQLPVRVPFGFHGNWVADADARGTA